jgi:hypothetical protein
MLHDMVRKPPKKDASETRPTQTMAHFGGIGIMSPYFPQREFNDRQNDPKKYQLEDPSSNRSHKHEQQ